MDAGLSRTAITCATVPHGLRVKSTRSANTAYQAHTLQAIEDHHTHQAVVLLQALRRAVIVGAAVNLCTDLCNKALKITLLRGVAAITNRYIASLGFFLA